MENVLVFGEDPEIQQAFYRILNPSQFRIFTARGEAEALLELRKAEGQHSPMVLAIVDVQSYQGQSALKTIASVWSHFPEIEILLCSADRSISTEDLFKKFGLTDRLLMIKKPLEPLEVSQFVTFAICKWNLRQQDRKYLAHLEAQIEERTNKLRKIVQQLVQSNSEIDHSLSRMKKIQQLLVQTSRMSSLGELASQVSHEMQNPLSEARNSTTQLKATRSSDREELLRITRNIRKTADEITRIVSRLAPSAGFSGLTLL